MDYNTKDLYEKIWTTKEGLEEFYKKYDPWSVEKDPKRIIRYNEILKMLKDKNFEVIVDIGCGEGLFTKRLIPFAKNIIGYDISETALERAKANVPKASLYAMDIRQLDSISADLCVSTGVFEFLNFKEKEKLITKILKGCSFFLISDRIVPKNNELHWKDHDFANVKDFKDFLNIYSFIHQEKVVEINLSYKAHNFFSKINQLLLIFINKLFGYYVTLKIAQLIYKTPLKSLIIPFISHMAFIVSIKPVFLEDIIDQNIFRPIAEKIVNLIEKTKLTPNTITLFSFFTAFIGFITMLYKPVIGALILNLSIIIDCVDGQLARRKKLSTKLGDALDHTSDDIAYILSSIAIFLILKPNLLNAVFITIILTLIALIAITEYFFICEYHRLLKNSKDISFLKELSEIENEKHLIFKYYRLRLKLFMYSIKKLYKIDYPDFLNSAIFYTYFKPLKYLRLLGPSSFAVYLLLYFIFKPPIILVLFLTITIFLICITDIRECLFKIKNLEKEKLNIKYA